jgi:Fe-S cluster biosynthesis and repair protein YggX
LYIIMIQGKKKGIYMFGCVIQISWKKLIHMEIWLYNKVHVNIKNLNKYKHFIRKLKSFLMNQAFYSIDEFLSYCLDDIQKKVSYN